MRHGIRWLCLAFLAAGCGGGDEGGTGPAADTEPPVVTLGNVPPGPVGGAVALTATASDNVAVVGVQFLLDGQPLGQEDVTAPYGMTWNSLAAADGNHAISARARDAGGNSTTTPAAAIQVQNAGPLRVIITTTGVHIDPDGYQLQVDALAPQAVAVNDTVDVASLAAGTHTLALTGRALNCLAQIPTQVQVQGPALTTVQATITCQPDQLIFVTGGLGGRVFSRVFETGVAAPDIPVPGSVPDFGSPVRWSPDGQRLVYRTLSQIAVANVDGSGATVLTTEPGGADYPNWSPDGNSILYTAWDPVSGRRLVTITRTGLNRTPVTPDSIGAANGSYSPDGSMIAFEGSWGTVAYEILTQPAAGGMVNRLTVDTTDDFSAAWSPLGDRIAFTTTRAGLVGIGFSKLQIWLMDPDGSNQVQLTPDSLFADGAAWSPDGSRIAFLAHNGDLVNRLFLVNADGSGLTELPTPAPPAGPPAWRPR
jgi:hypothetical protein